MANLSTTYMGIELKNPIIAGASAMTSQMDSIKRLEDAGVAALVTKSLFEEQVQLESYKFDEDMEKDNYRNAEMISVHPGLQHAGAAEHLMWVRKTKETVSIPVIASLNAVNQDTWIEYAKQLEQTGVDGLECNLYATPKSPDKTGAEIEDEQEQLVRDIKAAVSIPVCLKLSYFYTNPLNTIGRLVAAGADGVVLFNRLFEPDLDIDARAHTSPLNFSHETDYRLALRFAGLLEGEVNADICCGTGVFSGETIAKLLLAGASAVQVVSAVFANGYGHIGAMLDRLSAWMDKAGYESIGDFRGSLSRRHSKDPWAYTRAQYARLLINSSELVGNAPTM